MIRRARPEDHPRITEIRNSVTENVLRDPSRVTIEDYRWFEQNPGVWVWEEDGLILGFSAADTVGIDAPPHRKVIYALRGAYFPLESNSSIVMRARVERI